MFDWKKKAEPQKVIDGRFEIEREGHVAYLTYTIAGNILELSHTEVPEQLRGSGLAAELAQGALDYAREHKMKVDVVCDSVAAFIKKHPEYEDLVLR
jgi:predicted GNAT family acetyltransferase